MEIHAFLEYMKDGEGHREGLRQLEVSILICHIPGIAEAAVAVWQCIKPHSCLLLSDLYSTLLAFFLSYFTPHFTCLVTKTLR